MKQLRAISCIAMLCLALSAKAQDKEVVISGTVISQEEAFPLEGVTIVVKGTHTITGTLIDGAYSLPVKSTDSILVFSREGYESQEVKILRDQKVYNVILKPSGGAPILLTIHYKKR